MATLYLTSSDVGAPALSGTNGTLCTVLDWALVQNGFAIEYTATNNRIYRAATGLRFRLFVCHDSTVSGAATLATVRGCESATAAGTGTITDPFPTVAQLANGSANVCVSFTANATAREWWIKVSPTGFSMGVSTTSTTSSGWDVWGFGDAAGTDSTDNYGCYILLGGTSSTAVTSRAMNASVASFPSGSATGKLYWCRSIDGSIKSSTGHLHGPHANGSATGSLCGLSSGVTMRSGYGNRIVRAKIPLVCLGSGTTTAGVLQQLRRGYLPDLWNPEHSGVGSITSADTFQDLSTSATFRIVPASSTMACIVETTDTWAVPSG